MSRRRSLGFVLVGRIILIFVALATLRILTTVLSPAEVGRYYVFVAFSSAFALFCLSPLGVWGNRHIHQWARSQPLRTVFGFYAGGALLCGLAAVPVTWGIAGLLGTARGTDAAYLVGAVLLSLAFVTLAQVFAGFLNLVGTRAEYVLVQIVTQVVALAMAWGICSAWLPSGFGWQVGIVFGNVVGLLLCLWILRRHFPVFHGAGWKVLVPRAAFLAFVVPMVTLGVVSWSQTQMFRVVIEALSGAETVAVLSVCLGVATGLVASLDAIVQQLLMPEYFASLGTAEAGDRARAWENYAGRATEIYLLGCLYILVFSRPLMVLLVDRRYWDFHHLLAFGAVIEYFRMTVGVRQLLSHSEYRMKNLIMPSMTVVVVTLVGLSAVGWWAPSNIHTAIALVLCSTGALQLVLVHRATRSVLEVRAPRLKTEWFVLAVIGLAVKMMFLEDATVRQALWMLPIGLLPFLFVMRNSLREFLKPSSTP